MRLIASVLMLMVSILASIGAVVYPARTNGNNTFYGTNSHIGPVIVGVTNLMSNEGSVINDTGFTNGAITFSGVANTLSTVGIKIGQDAGKYNTSTRSVSLGGYAGLSASNAQNSVFIGHNAGSQANDADSSIFIGYGAGLLSTNADESVFIGNLAGGDITNSKVLVIHSSQSGVGTNGLIYGEFDNRLLRVNGALDVTNTATAKSFHGLASGLTNSSGYGLASTNENNMWVTNLTATTVAGNGESLTNGSGYHFADTNWVLSQLSALGAYVYITGVTNALTFTNSTESVARTNIWEGWTAPTTTVTTNTYSGLTLNAYIRHVVSTNTYTVVEAGPVSVSSYVYRAGGAGTVSGHYEFYVLDTVSNICYEIASSPAQTISATVPTLMTWSISVPTSFIATNAVKFVVAFKMDSIGTGGPTLSFVSGGNYDAHANFIRPLSSATINWSQVSGTANLPMPTNSPAANKMLYATSVSSAKWDDAPSGTGGITNNQTGVTLTGIFNGTGSGLTNIYGSNIVDAVALATNAVNATNFFGTISTNNISGAPTSFYWPQINAGGTVVWSNYLGTVSADTLNVGTLNLTNALPVSALPYVPQYGDADLTNWATISTNDLATTNLMYSTSNTLASARIASTNDLNTTLRANITNHVELATNGTVAKAVAATHSTNFWGQLNVTNFNSGTSASSSTYWRGDGTWAAAGTGDVTASGQNNFSGSNYMSGALRLAGGMHWSTNQNQIVPDFTKPVQLMTTNANFTFLAPSGVDAGLVTMQSCAIYVTNSAGNSTLTVTAPASCHPVGTMYVTNLTRFTFECYAQKFTNVFAVPVF